MIVYLVACVTRASNALWARVRIQYGGLKPVLFPECVIHPHRGLVSVAFRHYTNFINYTNNCNCYPYHTNLNSASNIISFKEVFGRAANI